MELVEYAQAVDHSRMPLLLRVLNALGWYAFLADIPLMAYAYCLVMARNGFPNLTMDEGRLVGASVLLPFVALALMSPAENWNPRGPKPKTMDEYVGDVWNLDGLAIAEVLDLDAVELGHQLHHDDAVLLAPQAHRDQDDLDDDGEQQDGKPPVAGELVARLHYEVERLGEQLHDRRILSTGPRGSSGRKTQDANHTPKRGDPGRAGDIA